MVLVPSPGDLINDEIDAMEAARDRGEAPPDTVSARDANALPEDTADRGELRSPVSDAGMEVSDEEVYVTPIANPLVFPPARWTAVGMWSR